MARVSRSKTIQVIADLMVDAQQVRSLLGPEPWLHLDVTLPQLKALMVVGAGGPTRPSVIAEAIGVTPTTVTGILDRLEERGLTTRAPDPGDRRATVIRLTPEGESVLGEVYAAGRDDLVAVLEELDGADLAALQQGMQAVVDHLRVRLESGARVSLPA